MFIILSVKDIEEMIKVWSDNKQILPVEDLPMDEIIKRKLQSTIALYFQKLEMKNLNSEKIFSKKIKLIFKIIIRLQPGS